MLGTSVRKFLASVAIGMLSAVSVEFRSRLFVSIWLILG